MEGLGEFLVGLAMLINAALAVLNFFQAHRNAGKISSLEANTNHKLDTLLKVTGESERAKGVLEGKQERDK